jgi:hypothetical protein
MCLGKKRDGHKGPRKIVPRSQLESLFKIYETGEPSPPTLKEGNKKFNDLDQSNPMADFE